MSPLEVPEIKYAPKAVLSDFQMAFGGYELSKQILDLFSDEICGAL